MSATAISQVEPSALEQARIDFEKECFADDLAPAIKADEATPVVPAQPLPEFLPDFKAIAEKMISMGGHVHAVPTGEKALKVPNWQNSATRDLSVIGKWVEENPHYNCAVVGKPDGLWLFDDDENVLAEYENAHGAITTYRVRSVSGGTHLYFKQNDPSRKMGNISGKNDQGQETWSARGNNRYVISAGSVAHPDNDTSKPLTAYNAIDLTHPIEAPDSFISFLKQKAGGAVKKVAPNPDTDGEKILEGGRNNYLFRRGAELRHAGAELSEIESALLRLNERDCEPALSENEVKTIAQSAANYKEDGVVYSSTAQQPMVLMDSGAHINATSHTVAPTSEITQEMIDANFPAYDGKPPKMPRMLIDGFLMGGVNFFGSLSGVGKSWVALAVAKALTSGEPLFGVYPVKDIVPVLYLIPESDEADFKYRLGVIGITQNSELLRYRTITQGQTLSLTNDLTLAAIKCLHHEGKYPRVLVIADTAVRFMPTGKDMASATNNTLSNDAERLQSPEVAADLLFLHHSPKASSKADMTLENVLRDTGDFGAMSNCVFGFRRDEKLFDYGDGPEELDVINVKTRSPEKPKPFRLRLKRRAKEGENEGRPVSVIDELGTLEFIGSDAMAIHVGDRLARIVASNPNTTLRELKDELRIGYNKIKELANERGWHQRPVPDPNTGKPTKKFTWSQLTFGEPVKEISFDREAA